MIRLATPADVPALARIVTDWLESVPWMNDAPEPALLEQVFATALSVREIWVEGGPITGYLSLEPETDWIHGFYVATPGQGIGKRLLDRVKEGRRFLQLRSHTPNTEAHRFYMREGFVVIERDLPGLDGPTEVHLEWRA